MPGSGFQGPRFSPFSADELADTEIEVSLLSPMQDMQFSDEQDALAQLQPVSMAWCSNTVTTAARSAQVWEQLRERKDFVTHLKQKAGLPRSGL